MLFIVAGTYAVIYGILYVAGMIHPLLRFCLEIIFHLSDSCDEKSEERIYESV